jgi:SDR family mycofactocin-dependent oxidoreductase
MPGLLEGKVAVVSGAARGQGRSHCVRLAEEGANIIALDMCRDLDVVPYGLGTPEDLAETVSMVEALDRRIIATETDVRDYAGVKTAIDGGVSELGRLDIVVANAGIISFIRAEEMDEENWQTMLDVNLSGVWRVVRSSLPHIIDAGRGGSVIMTSSTAAVMGLANMSHYSASKGGIVSLMRSLAVELGPQMIRVNTIIPTAVATVMTQNEATYRVFGLDNLGADVEDGQASIDAAVEEAYKTLNSLPIPWVEPIDISNAVVFLASDQGRYITGTELRVDAGSVNK